MVKIQALELISCVPLNKLFTYLCVNLENEDNQVVSMTEGRR